MYNRVLKGRIFIHTQISCSGYNAFTEQSFDVKEGAEVKQGLKYGTKGKEASRI